MKKPRRILVVLSVQAVERFLNSFRNLKHKALFTLMYSAGLRVGEILNLTLADIDSDRMQIRISQGKVAIQFYLKNCYICSESM